MNKLIESFPKWNDPTQGAIFKALYGEYGTTHTWLSNYAVLDREYFGNHSGDKLIAPLVQKLIDTNTGATPEILTAAEITMLAHNIAIYFNKKWTALYAVTQAQYDPIENYSLEETETPNLNYTHGTSSDYEVTDEIKSKSNFTVSTNNVGDQGVYGFNSGVATPASESSAQSATTTQGDADDNVETRTHSQDGYTIETETGTKTLSRSGNIGVTTSQQMLESEIALWQWNFYKQVFEDVDKILTLRIY